MKRFVINLIQALLFTIFYSATGFNSEFGGQISIPDDNFEIYLETHDADGNVVPLNDPTSLGDGILNNDLIDTDNVFLVTSLNLQNLGIQNLEGIQNFGNLTDLNVSNNPIELLDVSDISNIQTVIAQNCTLKAVNLKFTSSTLVTLDLSGNPNLNCILVDNATNAENAGGYNPGTGNYIESTFLSISDANNESAFTEEDPQSAMDFWISVNGDAEASSDCGDINWSYNYTLSYIETDLVYNFVFIARDIFGDEVTTNATFTIINGGNQFGNETFYGTGNFICEDTYDLNLILQERDALFGSRFDLSLPENTLISVTQTEGPAGLPDATISGSTVDFPGSGAGSYSYRFNIVSQKEVSVYDPVSGDVTIDVRQDDIDVTIFERKLVAYDAGPDQTIYINPTVPLTLEQLTNSLDITPDLPPQDPAFDPDNYWSGFDNSGSALTVNNNNGGGYYIWNAQGEFSECFSSEEEELEAVLANLTVVSGYEFGLVHVENFDFKIVIIPSFDSTVNVDVSTMEFTLLLPAGSSNIQSYIGTLGGGNWSANEITAATLSAQGLGDGTRDAIQFFGNVNEPFLSHTQGQLIDVMSFTVNNPPNSGTMSLLANNDPIANGAGDPYKSEFRCDIDNTFESDYYFNPNPNFDSFDFATLSVSNTITESDIKIYPNPTSNKLYLQDNNQRITKIDIYSVNGELLIEIKDQFDEIDLKNLRSSIYFLKIQTESGTDVFKLIKE